MKQQGEQQFEDLAFPGMGSWRAGKFTARGNVPTVAEGHTRLWRSTDIPQEGQRGWWATKPLTGYGSSMLYMDVPSAHEKLTSGVVSGTKGEHFNFGWDDRGAREPLPGKVSKVQFHSEKEYELGDNDEYRQRWGD